MSLLGAGDALAGAGGAGHGAFGTIDQVYTWATQNGWSHHAAQAISSWVVAYFMNYLDPGSGYKEGGSRTGDEYWEDPHGGRHFGPGALKDMVGAYREAGHGDYLQPVGGAWQDAKGQFWHPQQPQQPKPTYAEYWKEQGPGKYPLLYKYDYAHGMYNIFEWSFDPGKQEYRPKPVGTKEVEPWEQDAAPKPKTILSPHDLAQIYGALASAAEYLLRPRTGTATPPSGPPSGGPGHQDDDEPPGKPKPKKPRSEPKPPPPPPIGSGSVQPKNKLLAIAELLECATPYTKDWNLMLQTGRRPSSARYYYTQITADITTTFTAVHLTQIATGFDNRNRTGRQVHLDSISIKSQLSLEATTTPNFARLILLYMRTQTTPTAAVLFRSGYGTLINAHFNPDYDQQYIVLCDRTVALDNAMGTIKHEEIFVKLGPAFRVTYANITGDSINTGSTWWITIGNTAPGAVDVNQDTECEIQFTDI